MTYVITQGCCNDGSCIPVCPVQCIRPRPGDPDFTNTEQLYIDPATCIDCGACLDECPVDAIHSEWDLPEELADYLPINADYFATNPLAGVGPPAFTRRVLPERRPALRVAIVGSGPAACYAAGALSEIAGVTVSLLERLPTPFGLVRAGVAPDHPNTKKVGERFAGILGRANVQCFFNVEVGEDVTIEELLEYHHAVLWAGGAPDDRRLGIPGEDLAGCHSAREFVGWYNGHPEHADQKFDLTGKRAVVIGNGNVALDVARTLLRPAEVFTTTEMADHAIEAFQASGVCEVVVTARRGAEHAAYTLGELMALERLPDVAVVASPAEVPEHPAADQRYTIVRRAAERATPAGSRTIRFRYGLEPVSVNGDGRAESVTFRRADGGTETVEASLVLRAIGYRGRPVPGLPFDEVMGTLPNDAGKVIDPATGLDVPGVYCCGWIKRGPRGIIGTNKHDAEETVDSLLHDFSAERLADPPKGGAELAALLSARLPDLVDKAAWTRIDVAEKRRGRAESRPRRKLVTVPELLAASRLEA
ncbi:FAD-dependent oxidoreductase [Phytohabitans sp. ZYX-F-186]|uniref:ferredoxin--NADP(+) reductase n=1 Tax=Phytohabitans maris TaxID=3071409 RepID=A0ABU0ZTS6_9ACTN|nr:FAD-dependent oxidoreductase [Phytohabitans sp. ZYX-F-186]MDQ7909352.1 FAD-dependent oxidoreductase [Phytohabitans sp. ZYX-F-186]